MSTIARFSSLISCSLVLFGAVSCAAENEEGTPADGDEATEMDASDLTSRTVRLRTGTSTFTLRQTTAQDLSLTVDCRPPANPDDPGPVFKLAATTLGTQPSDPPRAGYWSRTGAVAAGSHSLTFTNAGPETTCTIRSAAVPTAATCRASTSFRSPNTNHTHYRVGTDTSADWEAFPTSGNHWGAWAMWNTVYDKPMKRGFMLHNLEHGGIVLSYKCSGPSQSSACAAAKAQLVEVAQSVPGPRVIVTADPTQPEMFAIRGWRYGYSSSCLDLPSAKLFAQQHYRGGREDADANPPIPFDPSTTNVPCEDLMAAPDSCPR